MLCPAAKGDLSSRINGRKSVFNERGKSINYNGPSQVITSQITLLAWSITILQICP
uniref:Uncharacterized protein n=1 Tax=Arundo donax TaxID=35708 RepID=A0A0A9BKH8_ARUDO